MVLSAELDEEILHFSSIDLSSRNVRPETVVLPADKSMVASFTRLRDEAGPLVNCDAVQDGGMQWKDQTGPNIDCSDQEVSSFIRMQTARLQDITFTISDSTYSDLS